MTERNIAAGIGITGFFITAVGGMIIVDHLNLGLVIMGIGGSMFVIGLIADDTPQYEI